MQQIAQRMGALVAITLALAFVPGAGSGAPAWAAEGGLPLQLAPGTIHDDVAGAQLLGTLVNEERVANGLRPLVIHVDLTGIAQAHSRRMAEAHDIWHNDDLFTSSTRSRLGARALGENVAFDGAGAVTTHQMLMDSPPHRANILDPRFTDLGVAITVGDDGVSYSTEDFMQSGAVLASVPAPKPAPTPTSAPPPAPAPAPTAPPTTAVPAPALGATAARAPRERAVSSTERPARPASAGSTSPSAPSIPLAGAVGLALVNGLLGLTSVRLGRARRPA